MCVRNILIRREMKMIRMDLDFLLKIVEIVTECNILEISGFLDLCRIFPSRVNSTTLLITMRHERKENWISFFHPV